MNSSGASPVGVNRRPRVLVVARMSPRLNARTRTVVETLQAAYDLTVMCETSGLSPKDYQPFAQARLLELDLLYPGKRVWYLTGAARVVQFNWLACRRVLTFDPDVVVSSDVPYTVAGLFAKYARRKKFVFNAHEIIWGMSVTPCFDHAAKWIEKLVLKACDVWLVPSRERAELTLSAQGVRRPYVVFENFPIGYRHAPDRAAARAALRHLGVPAGAFVVMFQGTLTAKRGLEQLVEAARLGRFHLVVQGKGALAPYVRGRAHDHVTLLPPCENSETMYWLGAADASFVYYENDSVNSAYACSNKFYASVFAGTPVLCNRLPALEMFADQHGGVVFFDQLNPESINACITTIMNDPARIEQLRGQVAAARNQLVNSSREERLRAAIDGLVRGRELG